MALRSTAKPDTNPIIIWMPPPKTLGTIQITPARSPFIRIRIPPIRDRMNAAVDLSSRLYLVSEIGA
jgi:hypothetical protein